MTDIRTAPRDDYKRIADVITLLGYAPFRPTHKVLDIGIGTGAITGMLSQKVGRIVGTGLRFGSYVKSAELTRNRRVDLVEAVIDRLPFCDSSFDIVLMSHVLEHAPNVGFALGEAWRVLKLDGVLCVLVPPSEPLVAGGHIAVGWNIGQLMYVLALHGFDTRQGQYARYGYNICAFVRKDERPLPALRHDFGDLQILAGDNRFPVPIANRDNQVEAFFGDLVALNWPWTEIFLRRGHSRKSELLLKVVPAWLRPWLGGLLLRIGSVLLSDSAQIERRVNPKVLHQ